jgi:signal peptidase
VRRVPTLKIAQAVTAVVAIAAMVGVALLTLILPRVTGGASLTVLSGSMSPQIPTGSVVLVRPIEPEQIRVGDVITFQAEPGVARFVSHRVVRIERDGASGALSFVTKGDANPGEDLDPVPAGAVRGRVWFHVPYAGTASDIVRSPQGMLLLVVLPAGLYIVGELLAGRRARRSAVDEADDVAESTSAPQGRESSSQALTGSAPGAGGDLARELLVARVDGEPDVQRDVLVVVLGCGGSLVDTDATSITVMLAAAPAYLDRFEERLVQWPDRQVRRSGAVVLSGRAAAPVDLSTVPVVHTDQDEVRAPVPAAPSSSDADDRPVLDTSIPLEPLALVGDRA